MCAAPFFQDCISEADLDEMNVELIRNTLYKAYLEAFYEFCKEMGGETAEVMCEILAVRRFYQHRYDLHFRVCTAYSLMSIFFLLTPQFEADRRALIITINSFDTELSKEDRARLFPKCGKLFPDGLAALARADDYEQVRSVAEYYAEYQQLFATTGNNPEEKTLEDRFFEYEVRRYFRTLVCLPNVPNYRTTYLFNCWFVI